MRIVTLNTWKNEGDYRRRLRLMRDGLAELDADVICLQEAFVGGGWDTAGWLAGELGLTLHAAPARAKLRRHSEVMVESTSGLAILTRRPASAERLDLPTDPRDGERIGQLIDIGGEGLDLCVLNLHLSHLRGAGELRGRQLSEAVAWAEADLAGGLVIAGDLNATALDPELAPLRLTPRPGTLHGAELGEVAARRGAIDHCVLLRRGGWRVAASFRALEEADAEGWFPSDHAAIGLDLEPL